MIKGSAVVFSVTKEFNDEKLWEMDRDDWPRLVYLRLDNHRCDSNHRFYRIPRRIRMGWPSAICPGLSRLGIQLPFYHDVDWRVFLCVRIMVRRRFEDFKTSYFNPCKYAYKSAQSPSLRSFSKPAGIIDVLLTVRDSTSLVLNRCVCSVAFLRMKPSTDS